MTTPRLGTEGTPADCGKGQAGLLWRGSDWLWGGFLEAAHFAPCYSEGLSTLLHVLLIPQPCQPLLRIMFLFRAGQEVIVFVVQRDQMKRNS